MSGGLRFTLLGSGSSGGVPRADGAWGACDSSEPRNLRSRCSLLVQRLGPGGPEDWTTVVVDTAPEFRLQAARAGVRRLDAVLYTHDHADQTHGIDDLRPFFLNRRRRIPAYMDAATWDRLSRRFDYVFESQGGYPAIAEHCAVPPHGTPWTVDGPSGAIPVITYDQDHGEVRSVGYRFGGVAYSSDVVALPDAAMQALAGLEVLIVDALRYAPHPTHAHVELALNWIARLSPRSAILTNLHIDLDYRALAAEVPAGVQPGYDGLWFDTTINS